jgi:hypothetical protein
LELPSYINCPTIDTIQYGDVLTASLNNEREQKQKIKILAHLRGILLYLRITRFFGLCPSSGIIETRKHNVSDIGSVSVFRGRGGRHLLICVPFSFNSHNVGWSPKWVHSARRPLFGLLYLPRVIVRMEN